VVTVTGAVDVVGVEGGLVGVGVTVWDGEHANTISNKRIPGFTQARIRAIHPKAPSPCARSAYLRKESSSTPRTRQSRAVA
jgi:hypothetical protein